MLDAMLNPLMTTNVLKTLTNAWADIINEIPSTYITTLEIQTSIAEEYVFDFTGLLLYYDIGYDYHTPIMLLNGFKSPTDYNGEMEIKTIDQELLRTLHTNINKK